METVRIAIADDHQLFREGLRFILSSHPSFQIVIEASDGAELMKALTQNTVDIVLLDLKMPVMSGMDALKVIKATHPSIKVIAVTMHHDEGTILHLLDLGANGYLLKNSSSQEVIKAIESVMTKDYYFTDYVTAVMLKGLKKQIKPSSTISEYQALTKREEEILKLICQEFTTNEIAEKLFISDRTVETHRKSLLEKLESKNTAGLVMKALKLQLVDL